MPTIESNIAIPTKITKKKSYTYIDELNVGDSFFLPCLSGDTKARTNFTQNVRAQLWKRKPKKFETRTGTSSQTGGVEAGDAWGIRVWRVADNTILKRAKAPAPVAAALAV